MFDGVLFRRVNFRSLIKLLMASNVSELSNKQKPKEYFNNKLLVFSKRLDGDSICVSIKFVVTDRAYSISVIHLTHANDFVFSLFA